MVFPGLLMLNALLGKRLEVALGSYVGADREPDDEFSLVDDDAPLDDAPDVWSDGSLVFDSFSGVGLAGVVFMLVVLVLLGSVDTGGTWICFHFCQMVLVRLAGFIALFLALCRLQRAEILGSFSCFARLCSHACWCR